MSDMSGVRFAPSPTGKFHIGNLRTAWISHAWARELKAPWVVRFEDIDQPRVVPGAKEQQLRDLAILGMKPDVTLVQSQFFPRHLELFQKFSQGGIIYPCYCSRKKTKDVLNAASAPHEIPTLYDGHCRRMAESGDIRATLAPVAWRFKFSRAHASSTENTSQISSGTQDFVVGRATVTMDGHPSSEDFTPSYNLACAIDDFDGKYSLIVRAWDLEHVIDQQRAIQKATAEVTLSPVFYPAIFHTSLVTFADGARLEKRKIGLTLGELLADRTGTTVQQLTVQNILDGFERSFDRSVFERFASDWLSGSRDGVFGETDRRVSVEQLVGGLEGG